MIYTNINELKVSKLGFGTMRLPINEDNTINQNQVEQMVELALHNGVNYFDTAWPYHEGKSEISIGKALSKYPRDSYYLADKYPGHQISSSYNPKEIFEKQLIKCGVDYFDFYLLHNVYENDIHVYEDPKWGIIDYFIEQRKLGRIKNLGFSSHARVDALESFLNNHPNTFDFCQIQLNYVDWNLQEAKRKVELLNERNIPIIVMEPVRGGRLANFDEKTNESFLKQRPQSSIASWAFNYLFNVKGIAVILSGMSDIKQMEDNLNTFNNPNPLNDNETNFVYEVAKKISTTVPCTKCKYCLKSCPLGLNIPEYIATYNELKLTRSFNATMFLDALDRNKWPDACLKCGACAKMCPQSIKIPDVLADLTSIIKQMPTWAEISKQREEAAKKNG